MSGGAGKRRATLAMVAEEAGVSAPTVSKVLNGRDDIAPATRARIEALLVEHDYVPRSAARRTNGLRSLTVVFDTYENPYVMEITRGVLEGTADSGISVSLGLTSLLDRQSNWLERVLARGPEALLRVTTALTGAQREHLSQQKLPFVLIDPLNMPTPDVASSDVQALGVLAAARHLGLRVPGALSVVSFDDTVLAQTAAPPLTAVRQPFTEMGRAATQILQRVAAGEQPDSHRIELATHLVVRGTTAPPADRFRS